MMSGNLQPKGLFELAFRSFITYMENEARQLMKLDPSPEAVATTARVCGELKRFFHGTRLPSSMANQLTKHLLVKLDRMYGMFEPSIRTECCRQMLLSLVDVFMHPDVTAIELVPSYSHGFGLMFCNFITWMILIKDHNLHNLKVLNLPACIHRPQEDKPVFPSKLEELTVLWNPYSSDEILRSILECCPELKSLTMGHSAHAYLDITLLLQCKHLETLRLSNSADDFYVTLINGLSTDATSDVLAASTLKAFSVRLRDQNTLRLIVDKLPHLTEIELVCKSHIDLSSLTQLKNLRSLSLDLLHEETANEYKKFLPVLGNNLVFLELRGKCALDIEFIGETCTKLKCLHLCDGNLNSSMKTIPNFKTIPHFKTIECLSIPNLARVFVEFLIAQCVNIKTLIVGLNHGNLSTTIEDVLRRTPPLKWMVITYGTLHKFNRHFIRSLPSRHPNLHVVEGRHWMKLSSQAEVFDSFACL